MPGVEAAEIPIDDLRAVVIQEGTRPDAKGRIERMRRVAIRTEEGTVGVGPWLSQDAIGFGRIDGDRSDVEALVGRIRRADD